MRSVLAAVGLALLTFPASASAYELNYEAPSASIARGAPLTFAVRTDAPEGSIVVRVSGNDHVDASGLLTGPEGTWLDQPATQALADLQVWSVPNASILRQRPGRYFWQAYVTGESVTTDGTTGAGTTEGAAAPATAQPIGPVQQLTVTLPATERGRGSLYPKFGKKGSRGFLLSTANLPATVSANRFKTLTRNTAKRWGLKPGKTTKLVAGVQDGRSVAGFSADVPSGTLGVQTDYMRNGQVFEQDLALRAGENWGAGPGYPGLDEIDLESVLLHELGHMAGNKKHRSRCANSPLDEALGAGEWWRGARDKWFGGCSATASASAASALTAKKLAHRVITVD
ncbi:hypothetical protein OJ997_13955 [Solirubrobacter phytolaccae]|uniref:Peptidase M10 metallopeptidase domain-containing protein n=1 Tax=Solirubrobacter phytolaccae TaxID=1404360 RepID=A0A9X3NAD5_9ACTN|nr:hypothetical protein [Solirubrobacter phytolaccae]MDA0181404.1 hypothetical protein [Solirubrobacter phytolaccae]